MLRQFTGLLSLSIFLLNGCASRLPPPGKSLATTSYAAEYAGPERCYRLHVPTAWQSDRYAIHERSAADVRQLHILARDWVVLEYLPYDYKQPRALLGGILRFQTGDWADLPSTQRDRFGAVIAQTRENIFIATLPETPPYSTGSDDARLFAMMRMGLEQIKTAFVLPDGRSPLHVSGGTAAGTYEAFVPGSSRDKWRKVTVTLRSDGSALLTEEGAAAPVIDLAQWSQTQDLILLQPLNRAGKAVGMPLVWSVHQERLVPVAWDRDRFGILGLALRKAPEASKPVGLSKN